MSNRKEIILPVVRVFKWLLIICFGVYVLISNGLLNHFYNNQIMLSPGFDPNRPTEIIVPASYKKISLAEMIKKADTIVIGKIVAVQPSYSFGLISDSQTVQGKLIEQLTPEQKKERDQAYLMGLRTNVVIRVDKLLKSDTSLKSTDKTIIFNFTGGTTNGQAAKFYKAPFFNNNNVGKEYLLFLTKSFDSTTSIMPQGSFKVKGNCIENDCFPDKNTTLKALTKEIEKTTS